jgi:hypothetical protein
MKSSTGRRAFLASCAMAGAAATRPFAPFGQAVDNTNQASSPSALRITDVKCAYVRGSLFVKIHTNQGIWGCGEAVDAIQGTSHTAIGEFPRSPASAWRSTRRGCAATPLRASRFSPDGPTLDLIAVPPFR